MTDITELAQREKFEAWFVNDVAGADVTFPAFEDGAYAVGEIYDEQLYFMLQAMWMAWKAAGAELVEALEKAQQRIVELDRKNCELDSLTQRWAVERAENADRIAELESIREAAEKLVRCKGRYHSEQNYRVLAALFGVTTPDLPPLDSESSAVTVKLPTRIENIGLRSPLEVEDMWIAKVKGMLTAAGIKVEDE